MNLNKFDNEISKIAHEVKKTLKIGKTVVSYFEKGNYFCSFKNFLNLKGPKFYVSYKLVSYIKNVYKHKGISMARYCDISRVTCI